MAAVMFCIFSAITAAVPSVAGVYIGRWFQGVAAAIPATVAFGNFQDMVDARARISVVFLYTWAGFVGLAMGPVYSAYVTERCGWRWVFYISTITSAVSAALSFGVKESKADLLLQKKVKAI
ncbi:UNVERIFIED_CONTAM: MFS transporter, partial [Bacteroidetes bacterium 56_B9]